MANMPPMWSEVRVGEGDGVEAVDVARPEVGGDDLFADVVGGGCVGCVEAEVEAGAAGGSAGVDEDVCGRWGRRRGASRPGRRRVR